MTELETATLGGGCFWCIEAVYLDLKGVKQAISGYAGGHVDNPSYKEVCNGSTGHAEVVQIHFDPEIITYRDVLKIFFTVHNPTTPNRQGNDVGTQYRSIILYHNEQQKQIAEEVMEEVTQEKIWDRPLVTQLEPLENFYEAEDYHQNYYNKNPNQGYCQIVIAPKVSKFRKMYYDQLKENAK